MIEITSDMKEYSWSAINRHQEFEKAQKKKFDLIIIGGGITGAGVCREAALRGLSFLLLDKNDFAFGTSSRSSKLIHGGFRYINNRQFKIVRESTTERNWLRNHFPNLVRPLAFYLYSYEDYMYRPSLVKLGLKIYNFLSDTNSQYKNYQKPEFFTKEEFLAREPKIRKEKCLMAGQFFDNNVDDSRLTIETIKEAILLSKGASVALNYASVENLLLNQDQHVKGVKIRDVLNEKIYEFEAKQVVNCTGVWADELLNSKENLIRPTKGVHIIIKNDRLGNNNAFGLQSLDDGRFYFVLRREKYTMIGTTDTDFHENLSTPTCTKEDCDYLFNSVNFLFPDAHLTYDDIISTYAGIRPLVVEPGKSAGEVSRKHVILDHQNGLVSLLGGKITIYRLMGEQLIYHLKEKGVISLSKELSEKGFSRKPFIMGLTREKFDIQYKNGVNQGIYPALDEELLEHLHREYGKQAFQIMQIMLNSPETKKRFLEENEFTPAEIEWICDHEFAPTLMDVLCRRTEIWMYVHHSKAEEIASMVAQIMKEKYNWDDTRTKKEIHSFVEYTKNWVWF